MLQTALHQGSCEPTLELLNAPGKSRLGRRSLMRRLGESQGQGQTHQIGQLAQRGQSRHADEEALGQSAGLPVMRFIETIHRPLNPTLGLYQIDATVVIVDQLSFHRFKSQRKSSR